MLGEQAQVAEFMRIGGQEVRSSPTLPPWSSDISEGMAAIVARMAESLAGYARSTAEEYPGEQVLRMALIAEEVAELFRAMAANDLVEVADGVTDSLVVLIGTACTYGLPLAELWAEVHRSNMSKFVDGKAVRDETGKITKGPFYSRPNVEGVLTRGTEA